MSLPGPLRSSSLAPERQAVVPPEARRSGWTTSPYLSYTELRIHHLFFQNWPWWCESPKASQQCLTTRSCMRLDVQTVNSSTQRKRNVSSRGSARQTRIPWTLDFSQNIRALRGSRTTCNLHCLENKAYPSQTSVLKSCEELEMKCPKQQQTNKTCHFKGTSCGRAGEEAC